MFQGYHSLGARGVSHLGGGASGGSDTLVPGCAVSHLRSLVGEGGAGLTAGPAVRSAGSR